MAKKVYAAIIYPDSLPLEAAVEYLDGLKWDYRISPLHDKDVNEDGSPKKPHYHLLCGFECKPPKFIDFRNAMRQRGFVVPEYEKDSLQNCPERAERYQAHLDQPEKSQYNPADAIESPSWNVEKYITQEMRANARRAKRAADKADNSAQVARILERIGCKDGYISSFDELVAYAMREGLLDVVLDKTYFFKTYIDEVVKSWKVKNMMADEIERLHAAIAALEIENADLKDQISSAQKSCAYYYDRLFGECPPPAYDWG